MPYDSDYLQHHGILGQKWGIRRFQNPDGSLTAAGKERYGKETKNSDKEDFSVEHWSQTTRSMNECEYSAWEYYGDKGSSGNRKAIDDVMNNGSDSTKKLAQAAKDFYKNSKDDIDKYVKYEKDVASNLGKKPEDLGTERIHREIEKRYPDYVKAENATKSSRERLIKYISDAVDNGTFDSVFKGYPPVSVKDDGYGPKKNVSKVVDGRKAVIASYIDDKYGSMPEYSGYGFEYFTPYDFVVWCETKTGKHIKM